MILNLSVKKNNSFAEQLSYKSLNIRIFTLIFFACISFFGYSQIKPNEKLVYSASYEMSGLMTNIAQVILQTETISTSKSNYLHLSLEAATYSKWDTFFKIRDLYESYVNPVTLKPSLYKRNIFEGGYTKTEKYTFVGNGSSINSVSKKKKGPEKTKSFKIGPSTLDAVTLVYKLRTVDYSKMKPGQMIPFTIVFDETEHSFNIKLLGKGVVVAGNLGKKECYKLSVVAKTQKLKGTDKNIIWLSTDKSRVPCLIQFSIPVGVGQLTLKQATGI